MLRFNTVVGAVAGQDIGARAYVSGHGMLPIMAFPRLLLLDFHEALFLSYYADSKTLLSKILFFLVQQNNHFNSIAIVG